VKRRKKSKLIPSSRGYTAALSVHIPLSAHVFHGAITNSCYMSAFWSQPQYSSTHLSCCSDILATDIQYLRGFSSRRTPLLETTMICQCCMELHQLILL